jgi:hypothetical protein
VDFEISDQVFCTHQVEHTKLTGVLSLCVDWLSELHLLKVYPHNKKPHRLHSGRNLELITLSWNTAKFVCGAL